MLSIDQNSFCLQPRLGADWINDAKSSLPVLEAVDGDGRSAFMMIGRAVLKIYWKNRRSVFISLYTDT